MNKKLLAVVILTVLALTGSALALAPMGTPTAGLKTGQIRAGVDYSISQQDIKADWGDSYKEVWKDVQSNIFAANLGYGITDDLEVFGRLGAANAGFNEYTHDGSTYDWDVSGNYDIFYGFGTKATFAKQENIDWGALFQIHWLNSKDTWKDSGTMSDGEGTITWTEEETVKFSSYEIQVAVGPTWKASENVSIYGGPFLHFISGTAEYNWRETEDGSLSNYDHDTIKLEQKSKFGGYVGAQFDLGKGAAMYGEFQLTGAGWAFGTGLGWKL
jgi:hypothetical protein